jgi:hypothetical protein
VPPATDIEPMTKSVRHSRTTGWRKIAHEVEANKISYPRGIHRPACRADCASVPRPCPFVSCRHNLYLDINESGGLTINYPEMEPGEMKESCSLDLADHGDHTLEQVGDVYRMTRERIRQIENVCKAKLWACRELRKVAEGNDIRKQWRERADRKKI